MKSETTKLPHTVIVKANGLLPMLYTVGELAGIFKIPESTLRGWLKVGVPHHRDEHGGIWINGSDFSKWVATNQEQRRTSRPRLNAEQAFCFSCNQIVIVLNPKVVSGKGKLRIFQGICSKCGKVVNRGGCDGKP